MCHRSSANRAAEALSGRRVHLDHGADLHDADALGNALVPDGTRALGGVDALLDAYVLNGGVPLSCADVLRDADDLGDAVLDCADDPRDVEGLDYAGNLRDVDVPRGKCRLNDANFPLSGRDLLLVHELPCENS